MAVSKAGLEIGDVDVFELNEAFASQATYCVKVRQRGREGNRCWGHGLHLARSPTAYRFVR